MKHLANLLLFAKIFIRDSDFASISWSLIAETLLNVMMFEWYVANKILRLDFDKIVE